MTREEQITYKAGGIADGCIAHGAPWKEYYQGFIEGAKWADANPSQPPLPSNIDEAAEKSGLEYAPIISGEALDLSGQVYETDDVNWPDRCGFIKGFKAGAEWMAGQGETHEHYVIREVAGHDVGPAIVSYPETFELGDKVIVQIRKKYETD